MNAGQVSWEQLSGRISDYLQRAQLADQKIKFEFLGGEKLDSSLRFDSANGIQLYRVLQEAIQNAIKYAEASEIQVSILQEKGRLTLQITDNGKGFDESKITPGNGLFNMRKRAQELGGKLTINSEVGSGTSVSLNWHFC
jgi:signal transduction histidine kinase